MGGNGNNKPSKKEEDALTQKRIHVGDYVTMEMKGGGQREGKVTQILRTVDDTPHPPKVVFHNSEKGKSYTHNPSKLTKKGGTSKEQKENEEEEEEEEEDG